MKFFLGYAESANYAGYGEWYVAKAEDIDEAHSMVSEAAEEYYYEQDNDQILSEADDFGFDPDEGFEGPYASVMRVFELSVQDLKEYDKPSSLQLLSKPGLGNSFKCLGCEEDEVIEAAKKIQLEMAA